MVTHGSADTGSWWHPGCRPSARVCRPCSCRVTPADPGHPRHPSPYSTWSRSCSPKPRCSTASAPPSPAPPPPRVPAPTAPAARPRPDRPRPQRPGPTAQGLSARLQGPRPQRPPPGAPPPVPRPQCPGPSAPPRTPQARHPQRPHKRHETPVSARGDAMKPRFEHVRCEPWPPGEITFHGIFKAFLALSPLLCLHASLAVANCTPKGRRNTTTACPVSARRKTPSR